MVKAVPLLGHCHVKMKEVKTKCSKQKHMHEFISLWFTKNQKRKSLMENPQLAR